MYQGGGMFLGLLSILIGLCFFCFGYFSNVDNIMQQDVQFSIYICGSIFVSAGFVCLSIKSLGNQLLCKEIKPNDADDIISDNICKTESEEACNSCDSEEWICPKCGKLNNESNFGCECGYVKN